MSPKSGCWTEMPQFSTPDGVRELQARHDSLGALCGVLERVADDLPSDVKLCSVAEARELLIAFIDQVCRESGGALDDARIATPDAIGGLFRERRKDALLAEEVLEALNGYVAGDGRLNGNAMGYLLRSFFDRIHQRIALERELVSRLQAARESERQSQSGEKS